MAASLWAGSDRVFLARLLVVALAARLLLAVVHADTATGVPHDAPHYFAVGHALLDGKAIYVEQETPYGPLLPWVLAAHVALFGDSPFLIKLGSIVADLVTVVVLYRAAGILLPRDGARRGAMFFAFSWVALFSSGVLGNEDSYHMLFGVTAVRFALAGSFGLAGAALGVAAGFKVVPLVIGPPLALYVLRRGGVGGLARFLAPAGVLFALALATLWSSSGSAVLSPYLFRQLVPTLDGLSLPTLASYAANVLSGRNVFDPHPAVLPFTGWLLGLAYVGASLFVALRPGADRDGTLLRDLTLFVATGLLVAKVFYPPYLLWLLPWFLLRAARRAGPTDVDGRWGWAPLAVVGAMAVAMGLYRWDQVPYSVADRLLMLAASLAIGPATWLAARAAVPRREALILGSLFGAGALFETLHARLLLAFAPDANPWVAADLMILIVALVMVPALLVLTRDLVRIGKPMS